MPYSNDEIKKMLEDAVKNAKASQDNGVNPARPPAPSGAPRAVTPPQIPVSSVSRDNPAPREAPPVNKLRPYGAPDNKLSMPELEELIRRQAANKPVPAAPANETTPAQRSEPVPPVVTRRAQPPVIVDLPFNSEIPENDDDTDTGSADFKMKFDFESAYRDVPEEKPLRLRRERRTGCIGGLLYFVFVICVAIVLAALAWLAASDILGFGTPDEQVNVTVPRGFTMDDVVDMLYDSELIKYKFLFKLYADYSQAEDNISAGSYVLNKNFDYRAIVHGMTEQSGVLVETTVTIPEGFSLAQIFTRLEDYGVCSADKLWDAAEYYDFDYDFLDGSTLGERLRLEGYLFPNTYNFYLDSAPEQVISKLLDEFENRFTEIFAERAGEMGYSIHEIITVASMIEREAGSAEERPRIAAVIYNRLNNSADFPYLQIDATIHYANEGTDRPFSTELDNPYNTYMYEGLPPGPISNPGIDSIRAALYPDSTNEYYYALNRQGTHEFFTSRSQHEAFVASGEYGGA